MSHLKTSETSPAIADPPTRRFGIRIILVGVFMMIAAFTLGWSSGAANAQAKSRSMVYELRTYTTVDGRLPALHARFRDHTMKLFEKHGMKNVIYLTPDDQPNTLVYLLAHESKDAAQKSFAAFRMDPDWIAARTASEADGKIVDKLESRFFVPTDYSPMK